ncbi:YbbR domain-containing protein [Alkalibacterium subtropicum]|uniref:YbbR domain-containing protein n=1 Tax=Alkalibacterium subtropicum TaxID=753702 RepID=A0A1I1K6H0_9LACT|nr:CdaR family protein [Alkalibacterium subtropicum]SFC55852.1 YbbR domain-containing protein [Alkalibacterium subtropicum]
MKMNVENPWISKLIALFFAIVLFTFVTYEQESRNLSTNPTDGASITSSEVITNLPIDINVDRDTYFVSGIPETATIRLEGPQAILTQTLATQNFTIETPDLDELGPGTHTIELDVNGLSNQLEYSVMPAEIMLEIEEKRVEDYEVSVEFNESAHLADGYRAEDPVLSTETVTVSGALSTMGEISDVMVVVMPEGGSITEDIETTLNVLVLDETGDPLNVNISPQQIDVTIPVRGTQRTLPIVLEETGIPNEDYEYALEIAQGEPENVTITGESDTIEELNNFVIEVDVSGVTESTIRTIPLNLPEGITEIEPEELDVLIRVNRVMTDETDSETESNQTDE